MLFVAYLTTQIKITIDPSWEEHNLKINFNVTLRDVPCDLANINAVDILGTHRRNVSLFVKKWHIDKAGAPLHVHEPPIFEKGTQIVPYAIPLTDEYKFKSWLQQHKYVFVDFFAPWCVWCQRLSPTWEELAAKLATEKIPVSVVKVDCVQTNSVCLEQKVQAFPTMRLYKNGIAQGLDYRSDRTVESFYEFVSERLSRDKLVPEVEQTTVHPGCMIAGYLVVNRFVNFE